jgi:hypothetical protein
MFRCSDLYKICTEKTDFSEENFIKAELKLAESVTNKGELYSRNNLEMYLEKKGVITIAKEFYKELMKFKEFILDSLPKGTLNYIENLWLENNYNFTPIYEIGEIYRIKKGIYFEDKAIKMLSEHLEIDFMKNKDRYKIDYLSGEPDIIYETDDGKVIRDIKISENWQSFRNKTELEKRYYFQVIGYCILTGSKEGYVDYILLENNLDAIYFNDFKNKITYTEKHKKMEEKIKNLPFEYKLKTFKITEEDIENNREFILKRLEKSAEYYNSLDYFKAMYF